MRFRSEWVTVLTLTGLAVYMMTMGKPSPTTLSRHDAMVAAGVDRTPIGVVHADKRKPNARP